TFTTAGDLSTSGTLTLGPGGTLAVAGSFTQTSAGTLALQLGDIPAAGQFGRVTAHGPVNLDGTLQAGLVNGYTPSPGDTFQVMTAASYSGAFASVNVPSGFQTVLGGNALDLSVPSGPAGTGPDLAVDPTSIQVSGGNPATLTEGQQVTLTWTDLNTGNQPATGPWHDQVSLVQDPDNIPQLFGAGDFVEGAGAVLQPGQSFQASATFTIPAGTVGPTFWDVKTDTRAEVAESNFANNETTSTATFTLELPTLPLDGSTVPVTFSASGQGQWFQVNPTAGQDLRLSLNAQRNAGYFQLFEATGSLPAL